MAAQYDYGAGLRLVHDSNITRSPTDPRAEWTETLYGGITYQEHTSELAARVYAQVERRNYVRNVYQDDTGFYLTGAGVWTISPQQFTWTVEDVATDALLSLTAPNTPANRAKTNSLSTGPDFTFRVNPTNTPVLGGRYGRFDIQGPGDNQRYVFYGRWLYQISAPASLSLNYEASRVIFTPPSAYPNFVRSDQFLRYETRWPTYNVVIEAGTTHIQPYGGEQSSGRLARVTGLFNLTSESALGVLLADQISDAATDTLRTLATSIYNTTPPTTAPAEPRPIAPLTPSNVATGDIYRSQRGEVSYGTRTRRIAYGIRGHVRRVVYATPPATVAPPPDYDEKGGHLFLTWFPSSIVRIYGYADYSRRRFPSLDELDRDRNGGVGATYRVSSTVSFSLEGGREERNSNVPQSSFVDRRVIFLLGYSTGPLYNPIFTR